MKPTIRKWKVTMKEKAMAHPIISHMFGYYDEADIVRHYRLNQPDIEWYKLEELKDNKKNS